MKTQSAASEIVDRGMKIFENHLKDRVAGLNPDTFIAIDVDSGDFEVSDDDIQVFDILQARRPEAVIFLRRVGTDVAFFMGNGYA